MNWVRATSFSLLGFINSGQKNECVFYPKKYDSYGKQKATFLYPAANFIFTISAI